MDAVGMGGPCHTVGHTHIKVGRDFFHGLDTLFSVTTFQRKEYRTGGNKCRRCCGNGYRTRIETVFEDPVLGIKTELSLQTCTHQFSGRLSSIKEQITARNHRNGKWTHLIIIITIINTVMSCVSSIVTTYHTGTSRTGSSINKNISNIQTVAGNTIVGCIVLIVKTCDTCNGDKSIHFTCIQAIFHQTVARTTRCRGRSLRPTHNTTHISVTLNTSRIHRTHHLREVIHTHNTTSTTRIPVTSRMQICHITCVATIL